MTRPLDPADAIFLALADLDAAGRDALLRARCGDDAALRARVEAMLAAVDVPDEFLDPDLIPALDPAAADGPLEPGDRLGEYLVLHAIGSGGMGVVYVAQQDRPRRTVAIKVLRRGTRHPEVVKRFEHEAELLGRLQHPGIAQVFAFHAGDRSTPPHLVMELVSGPPITEFAQAHALPFMERAALAAQLCDAVQHAHDRGIVHRDLKPANVLVGEDGRPKVLDFGIARAVGLDLQMSTMHTLQGQLVGTLAYMSPEQLRAAPNEDEIDARSDVYALGVLLYRLLAERLPFTVAGASLPEAMRRVLEDDPVPLGHVDADLRGTIEQIVARAMARDRADRYPSAAALAADLRAYIAGRPVAAGDVRAGALRTQVRRYRMVAVITVLGAIGLAAVSGYVTIERARANATAARLEAELGTARIERGRLLAQTGNLPAAEALVWPEFFRRTTDDYPRWALRGIYAHQPVLWTSAAHAGAARVVRFSADDTRVFTGGDDGALAVWDAVRGSAVRRIAAHQGAVRAIVLVSARDWIVTAGADGAVRAWRAADGAPVRDWPTHRSGIRGLTASPDASRLVSSDDDGSVAIWPLDGDAPIVFTRSGAASWTAQFDPSGTRLAVGWTDGVVELRETRTWSVRRAWPAHRGNVSSLAFSADGRSIATGSVDRTARIWNAATLAQAAVLASANGTARTLAFSPDNATLAIAGWWRVELWDAATWQRIDPPLGGAESWFDAQFSHDGRHLATASEDGHVRVWEPRARSIAASWQFGASAPRGISIDRATDAVTTSAGPQDDLASLTRAIGDAHGELLARVRTRDGGVAFVSGRDSRLVRWSGAGRREEWALALPQPAFALALSSDDRLIAAGLWTGRIEIVDARTGARVSTLPGHLRVVRGLAFSEDGRHLASVGSDGALHLWDVERAVLLMTPAARGVGARHVLFSRHGRIAVAWDDGRVDLVDPGYFDQHVRGNEAYQRARLPR